VDHVWNWDGQTVIVVERLQPLDVAGKTAVNIVRARLGYEITTYTPEDIKPTPGSSKIPNEATAQLTREAADRIKLWDMLGALKAAGIVSWTDLHDGNVMCRVHPDGRRDYVISDLGCTKSQTKVKPEDLGRLGVDQGDSGDLDDGEAKRVAAERRARTEAEAEVVPRALKDLQHRLNWGELPFPDWWGLRDGELMKINRKPGRAGVGQLARAQAADLDRAFNRRVDEEVERRLKVLPAYQPAPLKSMRYAPLETMRLSGMAQWWIDEPNIQQIPRAKKEQERPAPAPLQAAADPHPPLPPSNQVADSNAPCQVVVPACGPDCPLCKAGVPF
jgi:hypothetical protein